jgi:hypothetical protein
MSLLLLIQCDRCLDEVGTKVRKAHELRKLLKENGWVRAKREGVIASEGPLDYCSICARKLRANVTKRRVRKRGET